MKLLEPPEATNLKLIPFLKWAGGKRWLNRYVNDTLTSPIGKYYEPFAGSCAVLFALRPTQSVVSDTNAELINAYVAIRDNWSAVADGLKENQALHCNEHYYKMRDKSSCDPIEQAIRFIYLNRTCWNGLYRVNQNGKFNVPIGTKDTVMLQTDDFAAVSDFFKRTEFLVSDFEPQIDKSREGDLVFVDPPYTVKHKFNGFVKYNENLFAWSDQVRLRDALVRAKERGVTIVMTNADHESVRALYEGQFDITELSRFSSISGKGTMRGQFSELLIRG